MSSRVLIVRIVGDIEARLHHTAAHLRLALCGRVNKRTTGRLYVRVTRCCIMLTSGVYGGDSYLKSCKENN